MPKLHQVVVTIPHFSGFAEDAVVNTWSVETATGWDPDTDLGDVTIPIAQIYTTAVGGGRSVGSFLSSGLSRTAAACTMKVYDLTGHLDGSPHGSPVATDTFTLPATVTGGALPEEVALCATLRAGGWQEAAVELPDGSDAGSAPDRPRQRLSGRIYFGPFALDAMATMSGGVQRPAATLIAAILDGIETQNDLLKLNNHSIAVWSRQNAGYGLIEHAQVDNAWDTQRRRGVGATVRTQRTIVP